MRLRVLLSTIALLLSGCELPGMGKAPGAQPASQYRTAQQENSGSGGNSPGSSVKVDAFAVFKSSIYVHTRRSCSGCHGATQSPKFAVSDEQQAYATSKTLVSFSDVASSAFIRKSKDGHCGSPCATDGSEIRQEIETWKEAELAALAANSGGSGTDPVPTPTATQVLKITTQALSLPSPLPSGTAYATLRFDLGSLTPSNPDLVGALLEVEVQRFTSPSGAVPGSYRIRKPRLATATNPIAIRQLKILVNGKSNGGNEDYDDIDVTVAPQPIPAAPTPLPFPVLSTNTVLILQERGDGGDQLSVTFEKLEKAPAQVNCKGLALFQARVKPVMQNRCFNCHQNTGNGGYRKFNMTGTDDQLCMKSLQRINKQSPDTSALIVEPLRGVNGHQVINTFTTTEADSWIPWIQAEQ